MLVLFRTEALKKRNNETKKNYTKFLTSFQSGLNDFIKNDRSITFSVLKVIFSYYKIDLYSKSPYYNYADSKLLSTVSR